MDCSKPMYVPKDTGPGFRKALLEKGVVALIDVQGQEDIDAIPEGGVVFSHAGITITPQSKYFGPARWTEYTCDFEGKVLASSNHVFNHVFQTETITGIKDKVLAIKKLNELKPAHIVSSLQCKPDFPRNTYCQMVSVFLILKGK